MARECLQPRQAYQVAQFMQHSYKTQGRYYTAMQTEATNFECSEFVESVRQGQVFYFTTVYRSRYHERDPVAHAHISSLHTCYLKSPYFQNLKRKLELENLRLFYKLFLGIATLERVGIRERKYLYTTG